MFLKPDYNLKNIYEIDKIRYGLEVFYGETSKFIVMIFVISFLYCIIASIAKKIYLKIYKEWI